MPAYKVDWNGEMESWKDPVSSYTPPYFLQPHRFVEKKVAKKGHFWKLESEHKCPRSHFAKKSKYHENC